VFYPLFLRLAGKRVVVVGEGELATRKADDLRSAEADVAIVAPSDYGPNVLEGAWLVVSATDDAALRERIAVDASARRTFLLAVDDTDHTNAISPAVVRRGAVTIAISSGGEAPALTRLLREIVEQLLPEERYVEIARDLRKRWKAEGTPMGSRFAELVAALKA
jgi:uroporphyrin-III C-methyltransferase/precorrin-2 dehydrogenase/sirohydrochlorin ferrochelatase